MSYARVLFLSLTLGILAFNVVRAQDTDGIDSLFQQLHDEGDFNGNVLISRDGKVLFKKSFGVSDRETNTPLDDDSVFNLASITKQFTAACILTLARDRKLSVEDEMRTYIPELDMYPGITIENLIHHTSGLPDYIKLVSSETPVKPDLIWGNQDVIELMARKKPDVHFPPGERFEYSNTGYMLLATIVERVSKQSFAEYLADRILKPIGMNDTRVLYRYADRLSADNLTTGYVENEEGELVEAKQGAPVFATLDKVTGQGRLFSTTADLNRWSSAVTGDFFSDAELEQITTAGETAKGDPSNYGFGWKIKRDLIDGKTLHHSGSWAGYVTYIQVNLKSRTTVVILQNISRRGTAIPTYLLAKLLDDGPEVRIDEKTLKSLAGRYVAKNGSVKMIQFEAGKLYTELQPGMRFQLVPRSPTIFRVKDFSPAVDFEFTFKGGDVDGYIVHQPEMNRRSVAKREARQSRRDDKL